MSIRRFRPAAVGVLIALLVATGLYARSATSEGDGPTPAGGVSSVVSSLAIDPADGSLLKAGGGILRSTDQGRRWKALPVPDDLRPDQVRTVATTAAAPSSLFAAGPGAGVLRSDDRGETWRSVGDGLPSREVGAFAVHSFRPDTLYAWIEGQGVFRTEDGGGRWELMDQGPPASIVALVHSTYEGSMNTGWLYAGTPDGPYLSMDCF